MTKMADELQDTSQSTNLADAEVVESIAPEEAEADAYEEGIRKQQQAQFQRLKDESRALFGMVEGVPGVKSLKKLEHLLEKASDEIGNGRFVVRYLGAERYLDAPTVAVLLSFRQNLIADLERPTTADLMMIDAAIIGYYNFLRVQGWIGSAALVYERELFGELPLNEFHGDKVGNRLREQLERLAETILPLQDRAHKIMARSLDSLSSRANSRRKTAQRTQLPGDQKENQA